MINLGICLTDIPKERVVTAKNGKKYLNVTVDSRRVASQYGETHTVYLTQSHEERDAKADKIYVGGGKEFVFDKNRKYEQSAEDVSDKFDLPF